MCNEQRNELFDDYFETVYKHVNDLSEKQYLNSAACFDLDYKDFFPTDLESEILDVGCGTGQFLYYLKQKGFKNYLGVDISSSQIEYCLKNITEKVNQADIIQFLSEKHGIYDAIVAHDVLEHIPKDKTLHFLKLVYNALKKGGVFIARVPNMSNPFSLDSRWNDFTHEVGFTEKSLFQILWFSGFRTITFLPPKKIVVRSLRNLIRKILLNFLHKCIGFCYYIQDFTVPTNFDKNLVVISHKTD